MPADGTLCAGLNNRHSPRATPPLQFRAARSARPPHWPGNPRPQQMYDFAEGTAACCRSSTRAPQSCRRACQPRSAPATGRGAAAPPPTRAAWRAQPLDAVGDRAFRMSHTARTCAHAAPSGPHSPCVVACAAHSARAVRRTETVALPATRASSRHLDLRSKGMRVSRGDTHRLACSVAWVWHSSNLGMLKLARRRGQPVRRDDCLSAVLAVDQPNGRNAGPNPCPQADARVAYG